MICKMKAEVGRTLIVGLGRAEVVTLKETNLGTTPVEKAEKRVAVKAEKKRIVEIVEAEKVAKKKETRRSGRRKTKRTSHSETS